MEEPPDELTLDEALDAEPEAFPDVGLSEENTATDPVLLEEEEPPLFPADEVAVAVGKLLDLAAPGADVVAVHWRHPIDGMELDGDGVHRRLAAMGRLTPIGSWVEADFRIDVLRLG